MNLLLLAPVPLLALVVLAHSLWRRSYLTQAMVLANFLVFIYVLAMSWGSYDSERALYNAFCFMPSRMLDPAYAHTLITSMFMHAGPVHLIGNVLVLYLIGLPLEERVGTRNWGLIYLLTGLAATMMFYLFHPSADTYLLGASGAIYGLGGAMLALYPGDRIPMFIGPIFTTRAPVWLAVGLMFVLEAGLVAISIGDGVAHVAHVGGAAFGIFLGPVLMRSRTGRKQELDIGLLADMALKPEDKQMVERIAREEEKDVRDAWLDFFLRNTARCPKCRRILHVEDGVKASGVRCQCGRSWKWR